MRYFWDIIWILSLFTLVGVGIFVGVVFNEDISGFFKSEFDPPEITKDCKDLPLVDTAECLNTHVRTVYKYKITDDDRDLTLEELYEEGGDCKDWAEYYEIIIRISGYEAKTHQVVTGEGTAHRFSTISDTEGYCVLDQTKLVGCFKFRKLGEPEDETEV